MKVRVLVILQFYLPASMEGNKYFVKAFASNSVGTSYGDEINFTTINNSPGQIIADHSVVDRYDEIPATYLNEVKKMWVSIAGESHSQGYGQACLLESLNSTYSASVIGSGTPESYTTSSLRFSGAKWGIGIIRQDGYMVMVKRTGIQIQQPYPGQSWFAVL